MVFCTLVQKLTLRNVWIANPLTPMLLPRQREKNCHWCIQNKPEPGCCQTIFPRVGCLQREFQLGFYTTLSQVDGIWPCVTFKRLQAWRGVHGWMWNKIPKVHESWLKISMCYGNLFPSKAFVWVRIAFKVALRVPPPIHVWTEIAALSIEIWQVRLIVSKWPYLEMRFVNGLATSLRVLNRLFAYSPQAGQ